MNPYHSQNPQQLLALKRLEADALLDVLRTINHSDMTIENLCSIARLVLRGQLGVKRMAFYYQFQDEWHEGIRLGFRQLSDQANTEVHHISRTTEIMEEDHPSLHKMEVEYVVAISNGNNTVAYFLIAEFADSPVEAQNDLIFIETIGNILAVAINNRQLIQEKLDQESLRRELEVAEAIQRQLLISDFSRYQDIDVHAINIAHHRVGGDFYDVIKKGNGITFLCIADVSGKGIGAALLMSNLQANLRALCAQYNDLKEIITELNRILYQITIGEKFVTLFLARVDTVNMHLDFINAGHNYPIFLKKNDHAQSLKSGCILLGITPEVHPEEGRLEIKPGDTLFAYTDGVVEQHDRTGKEMYGTDRLVQFLISREVPSSKKMIDEVQTNLMQFAGEEPTSDDITILGVRFI